MRTGYAYTLISLGSILIPAASGHFVLKDSYVGNDFFDGWKWETMDDPTHGRVNYVDQQTAKNANLSYASDSKFIMRADDFKYVGGNERGRDSIRISSYAAYADSVIVLDVQHMPEGCGTWPAFWTLSQQGPWPHGGEIDIIEGVNQDTQNHVSLHTTPSCKMPGLVERSQSGTPTSDNCDASVNFNQGCGVSSNKAGSYGAQFNAQGGGFYVMSRTKQDGIRVWFWSKNNPSVPDEVRDPHPEFLGGPPGISPDLSWGPPDASFPVGDNCDHDSHFDPHIMIFDLTFCGDWAGSAYGTSGCPGTCTDFVDNNPQAFSNAYWEINALRVYTPRW